jgi:hypothetical protein
VRFLDDKPLEMPEMSPQPLANCITGDVFGLLHEHQRVTADTFVRFNCRALEDWPAAARLVASIDEDVPAFRPGMSLEDRMNVV